MNPFIFHNPVRVYFGEGAAKHGLEAELSQVGNRILLAYGGGSIKRNGVYWGVKNAGIFTANGEKNKSEEKRQELYAFGKALKKENAQ